MSESHALQQPRTFTARWLGRARYEPVHALQRELMAARIAGTVPDTLLLVEHAPVITLGRAADRSNVVALPTELGERGIELHETGRGGDVTFHGPGQLVAYPIFELPPERHDVRRYVQDLSRVMQLLAGEFGIGAGDKPGFTGTWVDARQPRAPWPGIEHVTAPAKLGAIGVRLSRWVTMHGFAFNASTDLAMFDLIVPCGIADHPVTSLAALGVADVPTVEALARRVVAHFETVFGSVCTEYEIAR